MMKPERQRIVIAEVCGWKGPFYFYSSWDRAPAGVYGDSPTDKDQPLPDYINDLNAMHEAEKALVESPDDKQCSNYRDFLAGKLGWWWGTATAAQRAEAFLKTLGKWEED